MLMPGYDVTNTACENYEADYAQERIRERFQNVALPHTGEGLLEFSLDGQLTCHSAARALPAEPTFFSVGRRAIIARCL